MAAATALSPNRLPWKYIFMTLVGPKLLLPRHARYRGHCGWRMGTAQRRRYAVRGFALLQDMSETYRQSRPTAFRMTPKPDADCCDKARLLAPCGWLGIL